MKFDIEGRIRNMRLPDGPTALSYSIFEAVMNGIQAIEERFTSSLSSEQGYVSVEIKNKKDKSIESIEISDNGVGLNWRHLESFNTCDTLEKKNIGGRGVGRLVWLKAFNKVSVKSTYANGDKIEHVYFNFRADLEDSREGLTYCSGSESEMGTIVLLSDPIESNQKISMAVLTRSLSHHFFPIFIAGSMPHTTVRMGKRVVDAGEYLKSRMSVEKSEKIHVSPTVGEILLTHVYVEPRIARDLSNSIVLTAQGRVVENLEIEKKFALRSLDNRKAYACIVRGDFLDEKVDQERTSFKAKVDDLESIKNHAMEAAQKFLEQHILQIRKVQKKLVVNLLEEHPQLAVSVANVDEYVTTLSPSMSDEDIAKTLFTLLYRHEKRVRAQIQAMDGDIAPEGDDNSATKALMQKVGDDAKLRLAEYTIKRHQIIQIAKSMLKYTDPIKKNYAYEKTIHDLICPMGQMLTSKNYNDHNLWLIDDLLSYYQFFASDKALASLGLAGERQEPDLLFLNPFGFRREGTNDPVVIIEFKRPGDEHLTSDPIDQVLGYIEKLRDKTVRDTEGTVIGDILPTTPFECIVICDMTEGAKSKLRRSVAQHPTPDGLGFYGFSQSHNASIRVISYRKLFRDAELRNSSFFEHLGLLPEEVASSIAASMKVG